MLGRDRLVRMWAPLIGPGYAGRLARSYVPLRALFLLFPVWWALSIFHALSKGAVHATIGSLNAAFPLVLLAVVVVTLVLQRRLRDSIRRSLSDRGFESSARPAILTPPRFRSWLNDSGVPQELALEILSEARPAIRG